MSSKAEEVADAEVALIFKKAAMEKTNPPYSSLSPGRRRRR
jgi:hypothetical protein